MFLWPWGLPRLTPFALLEHLGPWNSWKTSATASMMECCSKFKVRMARHPCRQSWKIQEWWRSWNQWLIRASDAAQQLRTRPFMGKTVSISQGEATATTTRPSRLTIQLFRVCWTERRCKSFGPVSKNTWARKNEDIRVAWDVVGFM